MGGGDSSTVRQISRYTSDMNILLVGEGDFSFAAALASAFKSAPNLVATSLDSLETLKQKYPVAFEENLEELRRAGAEVMHGVDVSHMPQHPRLHWRSFDCIVFNFPHSGFVPGWREYTPALIRRHRALMRQFFKSAKKLIYEEGEVHVTHHVRQPYTEWKIEEEAQENGLLLKRRPKFKAHAFPGYKNRRGAGSHWGWSFPKDNAATFIFIDN
eukprot:c14889_g1_i1 orf=194-835(-)